MPRVTFTAVFKLSKWLVVFHLLFKVEFEFFSTEFKISIR